MKIAYYIILQFIFIQILLGQNTIKFIGSSKNDLVIIFSKNEFQIYGDQCDNEELISTGKLLLFEGKVIFRDSFVLCVLSNTRDTIKLKMIDNYRLRSIGRCKYFRKNEILYATSIRTKDGYFVQQMEWKNGLKHGFWYFQDSIIHFKEGKIMKIEKINIEKEMPSNTKQERL